MVYSIYLIFLHEIQPIPFSKHNSDIKDLVAAKTLKTSFIVCLCFLYFNYLSKKVSREAMDGMLDFLQKEMRIELPISFEYEES